MNHTHCINLLIAQPLLTLNSTAKCMAGLTLIISSTDGSLSIASSQGNREHHPVLNPFGSSFCFTFLVLWMQLLDLCLIFIWFRFNGLEFLLNMRGKSMMFVGDSLGRNQWESLICLISSSVPRTSTQMSRGDPFSIFKFSVSSPVPNSHYCHSTLLEMRIDKIHVLAASGLQGCNLNTKKCCTCRSLFIILSPAIYGRNMKEVVFFPGLVFFSWQSNFDCELGQIVSFLSFS
jgi:hypothetical protein